MTNKSKCDCGGAFYQVDHHTLCAFNIDVIDNRTSGNARFSAYAKIGGNVVVGHGGTAEDAVLTLKYKYGAM